MFVSQHTTAAAGRRFWRHLAACMLVAVVSAPVARSEQPTKLVRVATKKDNSAAEYVGRIVVRLRNGGILLEQQNGRLRTIPAESIDAVTDLHTGFGYFTADEFAAQLLRNAGPTFAIHQTQHFVICSDASERYTEYCGRLLERVHAEFLKLMDGCEIPVTPLSSSLPVIIFGHQPAFQEFAAQQHPDTDFSDVPGYYSVRDNQMLIAGLSGDRTFRTNSDVLRELKKKPRQVETIVHEAVHQLAFNTGIQTRFADNPVWLSEGLAVYFEEASGRGSLLWSRPGLTSEIHLPGFRAAAANRQLRLPLAQLLSSDQAFQNGETLADAYAEGWALTYFLIRSDRPAFTRLMKGIGMRKPLITVTPQERLKQVTDATGTSIEELEQAVIRYVSRLR